jgi:hypothetical protein
MHLNNLGNFFLTCNRREDYYEDYCALNFYKDEEFQNKLWFSLLSNITDEIQEHLSFTRPKLVVGMWIFLSGKVVLMNWRWLPVPIYSLKYCRMESKR